MAHLLRFDVIVDADRPEAFCLRDEFVHAITGEEATVALHAYTPREWHRDLPGDDDDA